MNSNHVRLTLLATAVGTAVLAAPTQNGVETAKLGEALKMYLTPQVWAQQTAPLPTREQLVASVEASRRYFLAQQKEEGNFTYALDIATGDVADDDNQVRQAGAIWGLVTIHKEFPTAESRAAIMKSLDFVAKNTRRLESGERAFVYPGDQNVKTGTMALLCLALCDFYQDKELPQDRRDHYKRLLFSYLTFLKSMEMDDGTWARSYEVPINFREPQSSSYYDGEALLAYATAGMLLKRTDLINRINACLPLLIKKYTVGAWKADGDQELTKGFYQWGSMAFQTYLEAGWQPHGQLAADAAVALAYWQIFQNQLESRKGNTGYAVEGLAATLRVAQLTKRQNVIDELAPLLKRHIGKLLLCQFRGPFMDYNRRFCDLQAPSPDAAGGITDTPNSTVVRIDTVQHQVHATLMLLQWLYAK